MGKSKVKTTITETRGELHTRSHFVQCSDIRAAKTEISIALDGRTDEVLVQRGIEPGYEYLVTYTERLNKDVTKEYSEFEQVIEWEDK